MSNYRETPLTKEQYDASFQNIMDSGGIMIDCHPEKNEMKFSFSEEAFSELSIMAQSQGMTVDEFLHKKLDNNPALDGAKITNQEDKLSRQQRRRLERKLKKK